MSIHITLIITLVNNTINKQSKNNIKIQTMRTASKHTAAQQECR